MAANLRSLSMYQIFSGMRLNTTQWKTLVCQAVRW
jgi:hypothetical protein